MFDMIDDNYAFDVDSIINISQLRAGGAAGDAIIKKAVKLLEVHGWLMIDVADKNQRRDSDQMDLVRSWRSTLGAAFDQSDKVKEDTVKFHLEKGVSVGYKKDDTREFFETRLLQQTESKDDSSTIQSGSAKRDDISRITEGLASLLGRADGGSNEISVVPDCPGVSDYTATVLSLFAVLSEVASIILTILAESLGLDPSCLLDLTDLKSPESYRINSRPDNDEEMGETKDTDNIIKNLGKKDPRWKGPTPDPTPIIPKKYIPRNVPSKVIEAAEGEYSSSLLRVCRYAIDSNQALLREKDREIAFGAHTDTSFISIGLCSAEPGLEILDKKSFKWICPEKFDLNECSDDGDIIPRSSLSHDIFRVNIESNSSRRSSRESRQVATEPVKSTVAVVFIGEFLQVLTGGRFSATPHRVRCMPFAVPPSPQSTNGSVKLFNSPPPAKVQVPHTVPFARRASYGVENDPVPLRRVSIGNAADAVAARKMKEKDTDTAMGVSVSVSQSGTGASARRISFGNLADTPSASRRSREDEITPKRVVLGNLTDAALSRRLIAHDDDDTSLWRGSSSNLSDVTSSRQSSVIDDEIEKNVRRSTYKVEADVTAYSVTDSTGYPATLSGKYTDNRKYKAIPTTYRVSCPFLIRGKHDAVISLRKRNYNHNTWNVSEGKEDVINGSESEESGDSGGVSERKECGEHDDEGISVESGSTESVQVPAIMERKWVMPDLDGTSILMIHRLLDMKRKRCATTHEGSDGDWILSAFPIQPPVEINNDDDDDDVGLDVDKVDQNRALL